MTEIRLDNSMLSTFKGCPQKFFYCYRDNIRLKGDPNIFKPEFGTAIHSALEQWYHTKDINKANAAFLQHWGQYEGQDNTNIRTAERGLIAIEKYVNTYSPEQFDVRDIELAGAIDIQVDKDSIHNVYLHIYIDILSHS